MRRLLTPGFVVPLLLALAGVALIIAGQLNLDERGTGQASLPPIPEPSRTPSAVPSSSTTGGTPSPSPTASPTPNPSWVATQLQIPAVGINIRVHRAASKSQCDFPPEYDAWVLCGDRPDSFQPGRGGNAYIFAHARTGMFLPLWNVQIGAEVKVLMSDGQVLRYVVTEVHPNVSCPDTREPKMPAGLEPLALKYAPPGCEQGVFWTSQADHERLTLQTSQGFNRNWGEFVVVADPVT